MNFILFGKSIYQIILMLVYPLRKITRDSDVECPIFLTRENIDESLLSHNCM